MKRIEKQIEDILDYIIDSKASNIEFNSSYSNNDRIVPRVTAILSRCIHSDSLVKWANYIGIKHQRYIDILDYSALIGSECHNSIDNFLDSNTKPNIDDIHSEAYNAFLSFSRWYDDVYSNNTLSVIYHEYTLTCKYFGGTLDGLYEINGKKYLIDYKTSNHVRVNYFLQLAAYRYILRKVKNITIDGAIILQLSKNGIGYNEFILNFDKQDDLQFINDCEIGFLSIVLAYYNIEYLSKTFDERSWE